MLNYLERGWCKGCGQKYPGWWECSYDAAAQRREAALATAAVGGTRAPPVAEINWSWSGVNEEQEAIEAQRSVVAAKAFRAMALDTDFYDLSDCSSGGEDGDCWEEDFGLDY